MGLRYLNDGYSTDSFIFDSQGATKVGTISLWIQGEKKTYIYQEGKIVYLQWRQLLLRRRNLSSGREDNLTCSIKERSGEDSVTIVNANFRSTGLRLRSLKTVLTKILTISAVFTMHVVLERMEQTFPSIIGLNQVGRDIGSSSKALPWPDRTASVVCVLAMLNKRDLSLSLDSK